MDLNQVFDTVSPQQSTRVTQNLISCNVDKNLLAVWNQATSTVSLMDYKKLLKTYFSKNHRTNPGKNYSPAEALNISRICNLLTAPIVEEYRNDRKAKFFTLKTL